MPEKWLEYIRPSLLRANNTHLEYPTTFKSVRLPGRTLGTWDKRHIKIDPSKHLDDNLLAITASHEIRHALDPNISKYTGIRLTPEQLGLLNRAYEGWNKYPVEEIVTTNADVRNRILDLGLVKRNKRSVKFLNDVIDMSSNKLLIDEIENSNAYGKYFINYLRSNNLLTPERINLLREAIKYVPAITPLIIPNNNE